MKKTTPQLLFFAYLFLAFLLESCGNTSPANGKKALARVGNDYLYASQIEGMGEGLSVEDSAYQAQLYIQQWVQDALLLGEAKGKISNTDKIDRLVQDFRTSLVLDEYEQILVAQQLDSVVSAQELSDYYEAHKEQYQSGIEWVRCYFVKAQRSAGDIEQLRGWFKSGTRSDLDNIRSFCKKTSTPAILDEEFWIRLDRVLTELPDGSLAERYLQEGAVYDQSDENYIYLYKTLEHRGADEATPLSKVRDEITRIILHQRRMDLLEINRKQTYEKGKKEGSFELF